MKAFYFCVLLALLAVINNAQYAFEKVNLNSSFVGRYFHTFTTVNDSLVIIGGQDSHKNSFSDEWISMDQGKEFNVKKVDVGFNISGHTATFIKSTNTILIIGGFANDRSLNTVYTSSDLVNYSFKNSLTVSRSGHTTSLLSDDTIVITGGLSTEAGFLNDVWISIDHGNSWFAPSTTNSFRSRCYHSGASWGESTLIIMGGLTDEGGFGLIHDIFISKDKGYTFSLLNDNPAWEQR